MRILPILFNSDMVRAILDGRKAVTRRLVRKNDIKELLDSPYHKEHPEVSDVQIIKKLCLPPYQPGDILYVRETWSEWTGGYLYKAWTGPFPQPGECSAMKWHPSLHMPKEAARIWLKVTDVRVERLQDMRSEDALKEGIKVSEFDLPHTGVIAQFKHLWNSTIKKLDLALYGWDANPWVWVIEFERCEKPDKQALKQMGE